MVDMAAGDVLVINTQRGKHAITLNGVSVTQKKDRDQNCRFFQLAVGENVLKYSADDGYANLSVVPAIVMNITEAEEYGQLGNQYSGQKPPAAAQH